MFTETLQNKKTDVERIEDLADLLRTEDGAKKNGTSDVESRYTTLLASATNTVYLWLMVLGACTLCTCMHVLICIH